MADERKRDEEEKGFVVKDKRFSSQKEAEQPGAEEEVKKEEGARREDASGQNIPLPEITFPSFILSLSTSTLIQLGEIQDPVTDQFAKNLPLAKQTIDLIALLKERTKGNLSPDEEKLMDHVLYDLRMRYVKMAT